MRYLISNFQFRHRHSIRQYTLFRKKCKLVNEGCNFLSSNLFGSGLSGLGFCELNELVMEKQGDFRVD